MEKKWLARPYRYADGVPWNEDRYEVFVEGDDGKMVTVGGAIRSWDQGTVAFLCPIAVQRKIRTPIEAINLTKGLYCQGRTVKEALVLLKWRWPNPLETLAELAAVEWREFDLSPETKKPPQTAPATRQKPKEGQQA